MKDKITRAVFMPLFFVAFIAAGMCREWVTQMGVSDVTQMVVVSGVCFGIPLLGCISILIGLWKPAAEKLGSDIK